MKTEEVKAYLDGLLKDAAVDDATRQAVLRAAENEKVAKRFADDVTRTDEFNRFADQSKRAIAEAEAAKAKSEGYYQNEWLPKWQAREAEFGQTQAQLNALKAEAAAYRAVYGTMEGFTPSPNAGGGHPPNPNPNPNPNMVATPQGGQGQPQYLSREDAASLMGTISKEVTRAGLTYMKEFNEIMDLDAFEKHLVSGKYQGPNSVRQAFDDFVKPQRDTKAAADLVARDARIREEAVKEYAANHHLPVDNGAPAPRGSTFFRPPSKDDQTNATLADPNVPRFVKDDVLRQDFLQGLNGTQLTGALFKG